MDEMKQSLFFYILSGKKYMYIRRYIQGWDGG